MAVKQFSCIVFSVCLLRYIAGFLALQLHRLHWLFSFSLSVFSSSLSFSHLRLSLIISSISGTEIHSVLRYSQLYIFRTGRILISHKRGLSCVRGIRSCQKSGRKENTAWLIHSHFLKHCSHSSIKHIFLESSCWLRYDMCQLWKKKTLNFLPTIHLSKHGFGRNDAKLKM